MVRTKEEIRAYQKKYNQEHKEELKEYHKQYWHKWHKGQKEVLWAKAIEFFGPCACCGESRREFLALDHINGDGAAYRKSKPYTMTGYNLLRKLNRDGWPEEAKTKYRLLCHNCNQALGHFGYCPHQSSESFLSNVKYSAGGGSMGP